MPAFPSPKKRTLEKIGRDLQAGPWRVSTLLDPITEKRYRLFSLRTKAPLDFSPAVFAHRCSAAHLIAPTHCPPVLSLESGNDRVDILTSWHDLPLIGALDDAALASLFDAVLRSLAAFEKDSLFAADLFPEAIGRNGEDNEWVLLPPAYAVPPRAGQRPLPSGRRAANTRTPDTDSRLGHPEETPQHARHALLVAEFISRYVPPLPASTASQAVSTLRDRLARTARSTLRGEIQSTSGIYQAIFGARLGDATGIVASAPDEAAIDPSLRDIAERIVTRALQEGTLSVVEGPAQSGKTRVITESARLLGDRGDVEVFIIDEWDLFARARSRATPAARAAAPGKHTPHAVWFIDDIDEKALSTSDFGRSMIESDVFPRGAVVVSIDTASASRETTEFLGKISAQRSGRCERIVLEAESGERLDRIVTSALERLRAEGETDDDMEGRPVDRLLARLPAEARQLLELVAVARSSVPVEIVLSVFPEDDHRISYMAQRLVSLGLIDERYRPTNPKGAHTLHFRPSSAGLGRLVRDGLPLQRLRTLHRTLALAAEETSDFPAPFQLYHCLKSEDTALAGRRLVKYLRETRSEKRDPSVVSLYAEISRQGVTRSLPFADRTLACYELSQDLFKAGRGAEAEALLSTCTDMMESDETDQKLKSASLLSASLRLLADSWEKRGEYKRALELLDSVRYELQAALSIPDQARLLNDIGWLQYRLGDYDASMESCRLSLNTLNPNQYPLIVAQALNLMGVVHYNSSRYDEAISYYEQSAQLRERAGDENATAASCNNLALAYQAKAEYEKALEYYTRSLKLKRRQNNQPGIAAGYLNLALLYLDMRNFSEAEAKCRESLAVCELLDDAHAQTIPGNYMTLGDIAVEKGDLDTAHDRYKQSLDVAKRMGAINEEMGAYRRLSSVALQRKRFVEARSHADKALELVRRIGSKYETAQIEEILGDLELEQARQAEALKHYEKAAAQYTALSKFRLALKALSKIGLIHAESGNAFEARHYLDRAQDCVRADIGHELPAEYSSLQRALRSPASGAPTDAPEAQKIMAAFYVLNALTDSARDSREFFVKLSDAVKEIASPNGFVLALSAEGDRFVTVDPSGVRARLTDKGLNALFRKTLLAGSILDSRSADVSDVLPAIEIPSDDAMVCVPLKAVGEDIGCLLLYIDRHRLPLSKRDANFFAWLGRHLAASIVLMLQLNEGFLRDAASDETRDDRGADETRQRFENLIGKSEPMRKIFRILDRIKDTDSGILILGESGTGKSALARAIHYQSPRRNRPFREIHCAQIPYNLLESELFGHERGAFTGATHRKIGLCETADGGTLFLDDINVVPTEIQAKLLRFIENKTFTRLGGTTDLTADVRIVAASNEDLEALCREGRFREDLYFRLKVILIDLPPLRERPEDTIAIALDYLKRRCADKQIPLKTLSREAIQLFQKASWRGNVRELQNVLERVVVLSDDTIVTPESLPEDFLREATGASKQSQKQLDELVEEIIKLGGYSEAAPLLPMLEAIIVKSMVEHVDGKELAARLLGISKPTLYARLRDYDKLR